jgi:hypothetical protein
MKQTGQKSSRPRKTILRKWYSEGISNSLFVWIYNDRINWCLDEDAPYKDTVRTEIEQSIKEYSTEGPPSFIEELDNKVDIAEILGIVEQTIINKIAG